jgi:hypothetical protein
MTYLIIIMFVVVMAVWDSASSEAERLQHERACIEQGDIPVYHPETGLFLICQAAP